MKITGTLMYDVQIEEQNNQDAVDKISQEVIKAINSVPGVDSCDQVSSYLDTWMKTNLMNE